MVNEDSEGTIDAITELPQPITTLRANIRSPELPVTVSFTLNLGPTPNSMAVGTPIYKSLG